MLGSAERQEPRPHSSSGAWGPPSLARCLAESLFEWQYPARPLSTASLPPQVVAFIRQDIHSVLQLEVLLLLRERGGEWTASAVAQEVRITVQHAELRLQDLRLRGLLATSGPAQTYVYAPTPESRRQLVDELAACYATTRYTVINLIFSEPGDSARSLADAFRFRRKKDD